MTDSFDEAIYKIKYSGDFTDLDQQFGYFDEKAAAAYLRENFIPRTDDRRRTMWDAYRMSERLLQSATDPVEKAELCRVVWGLHRQFQSNWGTELPKF